MENTPLPEADKKATKGEVLEKWLMRIPAIILLVLWGLLGRGVFLTYQEDFIFPKFYREFGNYIGILYVLIPILLSCFILILYRRSIFVPKKQKRRRWIAGISLGVAILVCVQPIGIACLNLIPPIYSETDDPKNYITMDRYVKAFGDDIYKLFPANIPHCAIAEGSRWYPPDKFLDTTKYYYYFQDVVDPSFHIYAEWVLPEDKFIEELNRIHNYNPDGPVQEVEWGKWTCLSYTNRTLDFIEAKNLIDYYYLIFAYNEKTGGVRYIVSYSMDCGREEDPYFLLLEWE